LPDCLRKNASSWAGWFDSIATGASGRSLLEASSSGKSCVEERIAGAAHPFLAAFVAAKSKAPAVVLVAETLKQQEAYHNDLNTWLAARGQAARFYPAWDILPHERKLPHADIISDRLETLVALQSATPAPLVIVTSVAALLQPTLTADDLMRRLRRLRQGETVNPLDLIEWLEAQDYEPEVQVSSKGEVALRGGIVDVWPMNSPWPVRLEFFGDELESLREFDPHTQISRDSITEVTLPPAGELSWLKSELQRTQESQVASGQPTAALVDGTRSGASLVEHLPTGSVLLLSHPEALEGQALRYQQQMEPGHPLFRPWDDVLESARHRGMALVEMEDGSIRDAAADLTTDPEEVPLDGVPAPVVLPSHSASHHPPPSGLVFESLDAYRPIGATLPDPAVAEAQRREFFSQMHRWLRQGYRVDVFCNTEGEKQRFGELWQEYGLAGSSQIPGHPPPETHLGALSRGFLQEETRQVVVTDAEVFGRYKVVRPRRLKSPHAQAVRSAFEVDFTEFEDGDHVVHLEHGIGIFRGLKILPAPKSKPGMAPAGGGQECLVIEYAPSDKDVDSPRLYVPVTEAHLVSKYVGAGKARPILNTLGGTRWHKSREQAERAVRDLAGDLLRVQAMRSARTGHAFASDNNWQREFEASFEFEETVDQVRAISEVKQDMEQPKPMDRLLCGDVGFGKTEVAIRAAFKAVMGGRQVALLVPTTILAQQHYNQFRERMAEYPVRIELLSRYRTPRQQRTALEAAKNGTVDIIIGTHRLVQPDVEFKDLGLVIVDEEQRFGVKHKEQFKLLRATVDVLTLSATPIPRTLYMALTGARDLSTLETPPQDRLPVETVVVNHDERVIRDAILREMNRGGQTYFLHNRVATIEATTLRLRALIPDARIVFGHGQMDSDELEKVMTRFVNGEADVLVSTTIIESGLDIPNANTMLIDRADRFGLSELYQLRGRVGRYKHQAYCYLLLPRHARLLTEARKRMSAIKQYSALGSGFKIAMRDLEIRGAGNLLGAQQSGHITAVGFDLYCQLLKQSVQALKGEKVTRRIETRISLDFLASNPGEELQPEVPDRQQKATPRFQVVVPRDDDVVVMESSEEGTRGHRREPEADIRREPAYLPMDYIPEPPQRLEIHRKLAQVGTKGDLDAIRREIRDRFGVLPVAVELLLDVHQLRLIAADSQVTSIEVQSGKVKMTRNGEFITMGGQFPRLSKRDARGRLGELRRLLGALSGPASSPPQRTAASVGNRTPRPSR
jgi:transcription-repair coupling factor (superfamily II helicase)